MKKILHTLLHLVIMPCSHVPEQIERNLGGELSLLRRTRLNLHLRLCASYASKVERIDSLLLRKKFGTDFEDSEIEAFKEDIKKKVR